MTLCKFSLICCLVFSCVTSLVAKIVPKSEQKITVVYVCRIVNYGKTAIQTAQVRMYTPIQLPQQTVRALEVEGKPSRAKDRWGSLVLTYNQPEIIPGQSMIGRWTATATIRQYVWDLNQCNITAGTMLPAEEEKFYLRDTKLLALSNPVIQAAARDAVQGRTGRVARLEGIFDLVMERLRFVADGKWLPASEVLTRGEGSCSEYSSCFVALCRANGIPARYVAGIHVKQTKGVSFYRDTGNHLYSQAFLPGTGWVDFDPTWTDNKKNHRLHFGRTSQTILLTAVGDGGDDSWNGLGTHSWQGDKLGVRRYRVGWWFPTPPPPDIKQKVNTFRQRMAIASEKQQRLELVHMALTIGHPFVLPWLDDLLYEPGVRVEAAKACLTIGGDGVLRALVDSLGSPTDLEGDKQISELLHTFTGQQLGSDRASWNAWLKTRKKKGNEEKGKDTFIDLRQDE